MVQSLQRTTNTSTSGLFELDSAGGASSTIVERSHHIYNPKRGAEMEESFEMFEEELGRPEPPPQKPVRQVRRPVPEMYAQERRRTIQEQTMPSQQEPPVMQQQVPKIMPREPSVPGRSSQSTSSTSQQHLWQAGRMNADTLASLSLRKAISPQNLSQIETPWEGVTLNRCMIIAITILLLSSGFQKLHETIKGRRAVEEEEYADALTVRHSALRHNVQPQEPETSLYEVLFWWLPDFNDEDDDGETKQGRLKKGLFH
eukprot:XP_014046751.1 PREDICTED: uncharacterized protein LOC106599934 [Salmo salar]